MSNNLLNKINKTIKNPQMRFSILTSFGIYKWMSDEKFLKKAFKIKMNRELNLDEPKTFNEKLQWLKLNNRKPEYTMMVDKYKVRDYIEEQLGEEYLIPLLGVWDKPEDINFDQLPNKFVLKCNHNSGLGMCICKDKSKLDIEKVKKELNKGMKQNYYLTGREWPYKDVPRKIICEKYMEDNSSSGSNKDKALVDYKFFCFNGVAESVMVCTERETGEPKFYFFDKEWNLKKYNIRGKKAPKGFTIQKPDCIDEMFKIAEKLSKGIPYVRVDLYCINGLIYFGEMTFFPDSGFDANLLKEADEHWGGLLVLPEKRLTIKSQVSK